MGKQPPEESLFTVEEANRLLPRISGLMKDIQRLNRRLRDVVESKDALAKGNGRALADIDQLRRDLTEVSQTAGRIGELVEQITATGAEIKDLEQGLVDFRHLREGRVVYLCWKLGEERIGYWHELNVGFSGRQPL